MKLNDFFQSFKYRRLYIEDKFKNDPWTHFILSVLIY